ncbi:hypothetical protein DDF67_10900 [Caulobacter endophyticus]|uniref:Uncharacterized protein n=1 Tax=Caulobacter endophyticus TaxID=2172652 RepID=A0A2T9K290_9CAUL|nr:hypothetical protein DDF67_10900 [Caulobacter endophyticus]
MTAPSAASSTSAGSSPSGPSGHLPLQGEDLEMRTSPCGGGDREAIGGGSGLETGRFGGS